MVVKSELKRYHPTLKMKQGEGTVSGNNRGCMFLRSVSHKDREHLSSERKVIHGYLALLFLSKIHRTSFQVMDDGRHSEMR